MSSLTDSTFLFRILKYKIYNDLNKELLKILPFYNSFTDVPEIKKLSKVQLMKELPFYDELKIVKTNNAFSGYARNYKIEIVDKRSVLAQLKSSEISLNELTGIKHQVILKVLLSKEKSSDEIEYNPVYFNSLPKTVIIKMDECFNEIIFRLESWIRHGRGWIVEEIISQYLNLSSYLPLSRSTYVKFPKELSHPMKGLINIQNNDNKCFL